MPYIVGIVSERYGWTPTDDDFKVANTNDANKHPNEHTNRGDAIKEDANKDANKEDANKDANKEDANRNANKADLNKDFIKEDVKKDTMNKNANDKGSNEEKKREGGISGDDDNDEKPIFPVDIQNK